MSEAADLLYGSQNQLQIWDPALKKLVSVNSFAEYIRSHWDRYKTYTGDVAPGVSVQSVLGKGSQPDLPKPTYTVQHAADTGYAKLHPDELAPNTQLNATVGQAADVAKWVPGAAPNVGVLPDGTVINLIDFSPMKDVDPVTAAYAKLANANPNTPKWTDIRDEVDINGRGYEYKGDPSPEEQALANRFLAGDQSAAGPLAKARMSRLQVTPKPGIDAIMKPLILAMMATGYGAMLGPAAATLVGPVAGSAIGGAAGSGLTSLLASNGDWQQAALAAGSGLAGGLAGGVVGPLAGGGIPGGFAGGAAGGVAGAGTKAGLTSLFGGEANPWDVLISAAAGAGAGGLGAALNAGQTTMGSDPGGIGDFEIGPSTWERFLNSVAAKGTGAAIGQLGNAAAPGDPSHLNPQQQASPFASKSTMDAYRTAETERARAELQAKLNEYNAARAEAQAAYDSKLGEYNSKVGEYNQRRNEALERLRQQALSYIDKARSSMRAPLPPIPITGGTAAEPVAPDPFDPSAATKTQTYAGDYPITGQALDAPGNTPAPETIAAVSKQTPTTDLKRLPLNIMQIQAALGRRR